MLVPLLSVGVAQGFEFFGIKLFEDQSDVDAAANIADAQAYSATLTTNATGDLEQAIRNASSLIADQADPASGAAGLLAKARSDYQRILAALYAQGYYGGAISILVDGREAANLPPDARLRDPATVVVKVDSGPEFRFNRIVIANRAPRTYDDDDIVELPERNGLGVGEIAKSTVIVEAEGLAVEAWRQQGHANAKVAKRDVVADHRTNTVDVRIEIEPGPLVRVGELTAVGTERMDPEFVVQQTGLRVGDEFDPDDMDRAQKRLARLDVFRAMRIEAAGAPAPSGLQPYDVIVEELAQRRFGVGATYSTIDGLGVEGFHLWRNLFGRAERLRLDARVAGINWPVESDEFDYFFGGTFTKPGFLNPDNDLVAAISAERNVLPAYDETSAQARVGMQQFIGDDITLNGAAFYERSQFEDDFGLRNFSLLGLDGEAIWDGRDDKADAHRGFFLDVTAEPYYEFYYGNPTFRTTAEVRGYWSMMQDDQLVLAGRAKVGALFGPPISEAPPDQLFFAGGGGSVRGYEYRGIGVDYPGGFETGGRYLLEGSIEARYRLSNEWGVVGFVDAGNVGADSLPPLDSLLVGAGLGVRYYTGLGPLRVDLAFPLNKRPDDPDYGLYVGIGQAF